jgi:hypothetical protein
MDMSSISELPKNWKSLPLTTLQQIALHLPAAEVPRFCRELRPRRICSVQFWESKVAHDFGSEYWILSYKDGYRNWEAAKVRYLVAQAGHIGEQHQQRQALKEANDTSESLADYLRSTYPDEFELVTINLRDDEIDGIWNDRFPDIGHHPGRLTIVTTGDEDLLLLFEWRGDPPGLPGSQPDWQWTFRLSASQPAADSDGYFYELDAPAEFYQFIYRLGITIYVASDLYNTDDLFMDDLEHLKRWQLK